MGWARDSDLPDVEAEGKFRGAHSLCAEELRPMDMLRRAVQVVTARLQSPASPGRANLPIGNSEDDEISRREESSAGVARDRETMRTK